MSIGSSNIRVFVDWIESTVFAGEEIKCNLIFKNVAANTSAKKAIAYSSSNSKSTERPDLKKKHDKFSTPISSLPDWTNRPAATRRCHRPTLSLNLPATTGLQNQKTLSCNGSTKKTTEKGTHKRSISIMSFGNSEKGNDQANTFTNLFERSLRFPKVHGRSASLQTIPQNQALFNHQSLIQKPFSLSPPPEKTPSSYSLSKDSVVGAAQMESLLNTYTETSLSSLNHPNSLASPRFQYLAKVVPHPRPISSETDFNELLKGPKKNFSISPGKISPASTMSLPINFVRTSRHSEELCKISNKSSETFGSDFRSHLHSFKTSHSDNKCCSAIPSSTKDQKRPETLMMGYAQVHGSFILDSSLVYQAPFEEVKRKGIIGGQGGGVVGVETNKRDSGILRSFGWANIGAIGDLLGSNELSSIKEFREVLSSRSIPLLATPKSILFVDLQLNPGESSCYNYSFRIPSGLPPSHRGKAIKIMYKLLIGIQRPGGAKEQLIRSIEVPFRVLGSVDSTGRPLSHDLMCPYIILQDQARIKSSPEIVFGKVTFEESFKPNESTINNFVSYVDRLLSKSHNNSSPNLILPVDISGSCPPLIVEEPTTTKEVIDLAILRSNLATDDQKSPNRFEIARSGKKVAVLMLTRPSYRLGETISAVIDFTDAKIPCYAIHASLESSEKVDSSISLRSEASILRFTRKTFVTHSESTLFSNRILFTPTIPTSATPEFVTSGISLEWRIRIEFITPRLENSSKFVQDYPDLLEQVSADDHELIFAAVETLDCDSFQIVVPLRVYGVQAAIEGDISLGNWLAV